MKTVLLSPTLICFSTLALASIDENPIEFSVIPNIPNISCDGSPIDATYTVINQEEAATIIVTPKEIINHDDFPDNLVVIESASAPDSLTTCDNTYLKPGQTCNINLIIAPENCGSGTILGPIDRTLVVATGTQYKDPTAPIKFAYTNLGAGDGFAILGNEVHNQGSTSSVTGSVGHTGTTAISGPFHVSEGQLYLSPTDPNVINANSAFLNSYQKFIDNKAKCRKHADISFPTELQASYYCLTSNQPFDEVTIDGLIILSGKGDFVFFIDDGMDICFPPPTESVPTSNAPCDLKIKSTTSFLYKNGASPDRVFWLTGRGNHIKMESGVELDGTLFSGGDITTSVEGPSPASVEGHLWALGTITLYGDSVAIHD